MVAPSSPAIRPALMQALIGSIAMLSGSIVSAAAGHAEHGGATTPALAGMLLALVGLALITDLVTRRRRTDESRDTARQ